MLNLVAKTFLQSSMAVTSFEIDDDNSGDELDLQGENSIGSVVGLLKEAKKEIRKPSRLGSFLATQNGLEGTELRPVIAVDTRWNSTYLMLNRFLQWRVSVTASLPD